MMVDSYSMTMAIIFFIATFFLEWLIIWLFLRKNDTGIALNVFLINLFTWPLVQIFYDGTGNSFLILETVTILVEVVLLKYLIDVKWGRTIAAVVAANVVSAFAGRLF